MIAPLPHAAATLTLPYLGYDPSTFELSGSTPRGLVRQNLSDLADAFSARVAQEKARQELAVYYYRINHTMAFPLPLAARPEQMPSGIPEMKAYPWLTWLSWALEERWRLLFAAWQQHDEAAGELLQRELAALAGWRSFVETNGDAGLALGHIAGVLALVLRHAQALHPSWHTSIRQAAMHLLEHDTLPWFAKHWEGIAEPLTAADLHNIPVIALVRSAQLARVLEHPAADRLEASAQNAIGAWARLRLEPTAPHTEGTAYDGYLMDSVTEWLDGVHGRDKLLASLKPAMLSMAEHWLAMALPGRVDLQAPIADVEPEMPFWMSVLVRVALWYDECAGNGVWWFLQHLPPDRMPAAALVLLLQHGEQLAMTAPAPQASAPKVVPNAVVMRSGWRSEDVLVAVGAGKSRMSHLHQDSGQVVIGWQNRFWLTDPGYQQYRRGEERDFSVGNMAHNAPVINGVAQTQRAAQVVELAGTHEQRYARLDLTACYTGLPAQARVLRHVWLALQSAPCVIVADELDGFDPGTEVITSWHFGTHLAWAFPDGAARLSDGQHTLWVTLHGVSLSPRELLRHAGSRGPLTLSHHHAFSSSPQISWWIFQFEPAITWSRPAVDLTQLTLPTDALSVPLPV